MIVTDKFVFLHLHKSGGTFLNKVISTLFPTAKEIGYHYPMSMIPQEYRHLPVLGVVRNPWDFYVSYYAFQQYHIAQAETIIGNLSQKEYQLLVEKGIDFRERVDILFDEMSNKGTLDFHETTTNLLNLGTPTGKLDEVLELMPTELGRRHRFSPRQTEGGRGQNVTQNDLESIRGTEDGFYTFLWKRMFGTGEGVYFAKMENLRQDFMDFLLGLGVDVNQDIEDLILSAHPANVSKHQHYSSYYTPELETLVRQRDSFLVNRFGFDFLK